ncbi:hypothetical protein [Streptomyces sp. NPDC007346]|uniref:hypothetical protein n=1 Tax=Streptomyces sp. NPDC007346 TaxID=3154682 RepID=UPI0034540020
MVSRVGGARSGSVMDGRLLLLAALLFGIVTMHTVGHPAEHEVAAPSGSMSDVVDVPDVVDVSDVVTMANVMDVSDVVDVADVVAMSHVVAVPVAAADLALGAGHPSHRSPDDGPMSGMDPLSVCLAVLGAWGLALLGAWLLGPLADGRAIGTPVGAGLLRAPRPNPPPPIPVLAAVSVLRI